MTEEKVKSEKLERFKAAMRKETPDIVPVFPIIEQWANFAMGVSIIDSYTKDPQILADCFKKLLSEVYVDVLYGTGNLRPVKLLRTIGNSLYHISEEGVMIEGGKGETMFAEEYEQLIKDPKDFITNTLLPRKFPVLQNEETAVDVWHQGIKDVAEWLEYNKTVNGILKEDLNIDVVCKSSANLAPDVLLDYFRDFVGIMGDIRRRPKEVLAACDALMPMLIGAAKASWPNPSDEGVVFMPLHLATYLKPKDFAKFYFPYMKRQTEELWAAGYPVMYYCENDWTPYIDILQDMPDCHMMGLFEGGDLKFIKEKLGHKFTFSGGMRLNNLKNGTVQDCIDNAKWCLDNLAPGGGYIFGLDINLCYRNDAKLENLVAACNYIHENGKY